MIRDYKPDDLEKIMDIADRAWAGIHDAYKNIFGNELFNILVPDEHFRKGKEVKTFVSEHPDWIYICEEDNTVVGFVTFTIDKEKKIGEISNNAVDPKCSLKGMGQQMYKAVFERFKQEGMIYACVRTGLDEGHAPARRAYERAGFNISRGMVSYFMKLDEKESPCRCDDIPL
jgi:ribosomal protein S18 acetylase RimI-like enzyme